MPIWFLARHAMACIICLLIMLRSGLLNARPPVEVVSSPRHRTENEAAEFIRKACNGDPSQTILPCLWSKSYGHLIELEQKIGRGLKLHLDQIQDLARLADPESPAIAPEYGEYLRRLSEFSMASLLLLHDWRLHWSHSRYEQGGTQLTTQGLDQAVLSALINRTAMDPFTQNLQRARITANLEQLLNVQLSTSSNELYKALNGDVGQLLREDTVAADLHGYLEAGPTHHTPADAFANALYALWADGRPGLITINPVEIFFLPPRVAARTNIANVDRPEWRRRWRLLDMADSSQDSISAPAELSDNLTSDCSRVRRWVERPSNREVDGEFLRNLGERFDRDCQTQTLRGRGFNIWTSSGIGIERPPSDFRMEDQARQSTSLSLREVRALKDLFVLAMTSELQRNLGALRRNASQPLSPDRMLRASVFRSLSSLFDEGELGHSTIPELRASLPDSSNPNMNELIATLTHVGAVK